MTHPISGLFKNLATALFILLCVTSFAQEISTDAGVIKEGETLFNANCKACHRIDQKLIGPALAGVYDRAPSLDWIKNFVRNSSKVIASGDEYANKIFAENGKMMMTSFTSFSDDQIMAIMAYVENETNKPAEVVATTTAAGGGEGGAGAGVPTSYLNAILIGMIVILLLLLVILGLIINGLKRYLDQKDLTEEDREVVHSPITLSTIVQSRGFIFIVVFIVASVSFKTVIDGLYSIGVQQGYAPKQPIAFSHKVHAGQYEIDCKYCHTGAIKGRSANIPSPNICMNCHTQIRSGTNTGESEIAKIVAAVETNRPIEWVRVHNLPDLAYFNHSQHVNVGGIECQTCHGPIEEMDVVKQYSLLTMGWCIDCHRKTDVNAKGNAYYDNLRELHNNKAMKVEDIGGLECAKCHY
ncbi:MAG: c-type cytochrome [Cyclobacteriaceae bacterium]|nr:c-type cytochrome [Cyclobacteriaceae bacterium]